MYISMQVSIYMDIHVYIYTYRKMHPHILYGYIGLRVKDPRPLNTLVLAVVIEIGFQEIHEFGVLETSE